ncbi:MAG TPA: CoA transferase [Candidatus Binatia bacterium]|nr:CoA transferase [Candidatus Binatia bacterium]
MQGLEGVKVLELGHMVSAAYATKLMADVGADVIKVEEPGGDRARQRGPFPRGIVDPEQSGLFLYLNTNKRGCTLDFRRDKDTLARLVAWADLLIHNYPPAQMTELEIDYHTFRTINSRLVMCSITPFGLTGPHKDYNAYELTIAHGGGWAWLSPGGSDRPDLPPLKAAGQQADFQGGVAAATAALAAYYHALQTGEGEHLDFSSQAYISSFVDVSAPYYTYQGYVASRLGKRVLYPWGIFPCQDGLMFLVVGEEDQWQRLLALMGNPEWGAWEIFQGLANRTKNQDVLQMYLADWIKGWRVEDLFRAGQAQRICFAPVFTMAQLARQEQLHARHFFIDVTHSRAGTLTHLGAPYQLHEPWWQIRRPAPLLGEHNQEVLGLSLTASDTSSPAASLKFQVSSSQPSTPSTQPLAPSPRLLLEGVRVADFSWVWAGPFCALHLAHLGAEVIKIESQTHLDLARRLPFHPKDMKPGVNRCVLFNQWGQGKKSLLLNLTTAKGIATAKELVSKSDIVVENFATGVMDGLGLGYEELRKIKPDLIMASISGYGHTGPQRNYMAYGPAIAPLTGLSSITGYEGGPPQEVGMAYGDPTSGIHAAVAICAALAARQRTGRGQHIDVSLWEAVAVLMPEGWMNYAMNGTQPPRQGNRDPWMAPHNCFRCAGEDEWVTIACGSEAEWQALCQAIGQPQLVVDARFRTAQERKANEDALEEILTAWTATHEKWDVTRTLQAVGVAAFPSMTAKDLVEDSHLNARGFFVRLVHPEVGVRTHMGMPWLLTHAPNGVRTPAPLLGQDTDQVMRDVLGYSIQEIARLTEERVLY